MQIQKDCVVTIEYTVRTEAGETVDTSDNQAPLSFIQGTGAIFPALEQELEGHHSGERVTVKLSPEQAYGERDERLLKEMPREQFKFNENIEPGMHYKTVRDGEQIDITITAVNEKTVTVDANSPLAGVPITVDLVITEVRDASPKELETGEVQDMDDVYSK